MKLVYFESTLFLFYTIDNFDISINIILEDIYMLDTKNTNPLINGVAVWTFPGFRVTANDHRLPDVVPSIDDISLQFVKWRFEIFAASSRHLFRVNSDKTLSPTPYLSVYSESEGCVISREEAFASISA